MNDQLINPKEHRQLFLDDHALDRVSGINRVLHQPQKYGPVITPDSSMGQKSLQAESVPQWNSEKSMWEWWYHNGLTYYATSDDGLTWERPSLGLHEWNGSKDNNIARDPDMKSLKHIIRDENDSDPMWRYKAMFTAGDRYFGVSPDGFEWTILDVPPIPSEDTSHFAYDELNSQYIATVKHQTEWGRSVWLSTSHDFLQWTKPELILHTDEIDWENCRKRVREVIDNPAYITPPIIDDVDYFAELYSMAVLPYEGIYIGLPMIFNPFGAIPPPDMNFSRINQIELAVSRDLYNWERVADRSVFIGIEPWDGVNYDTSQVGICGSPIVRDNGIWIYYNAIRFTYRKEFYQRFNQNRELFRLNVDPDLFNHTSALCLAKLRLDGFVSLDAADVGMVVTKPFMFDGDKLFVNADARWGEIHAEIQDAETGKTHPGFVVHRGETVPFRGDHLRGQMKWRDNPQLVFEKPVRIRFYLRKARLYSFWIE